MNQSVMKLRARTRKGIVNVDIADTATVGHLKHQLAALDISCGFPPKRIEAPDSTQLNRVLSNGEIVIAEGHRPKDASQPAASKPAASQPTASQPTASQPSASQPTASQPTASQPVPPSTVSRAEQTASADHGTIVMREVPDDNSCLFRSVNALLGHRNRSAEHLRRIIATAIVDDPSLYTEAFLGRPPAEYSAWILSDNAWGGAIELAILAKHFCIQLAAFDVHTMRLDRYGETDAFPYIAFLIYTGIHYNYAALALDPSSMDVDVLQFSPHDHVVLNKIKAVAQILHDSHSYTDTASFALKCLQCGTKLKGEKQAVEHAKVTGHSQFNEK